MLINFKLTTQQNYLVITNKYLPRQTFYKSSIFRQNFSKQKTFISGKKHGFDLLKSTYSLNNNSVSKKTITSNASRASYSLKHQLPAANNLRFKKFYYYYKSWRGRSKSGVMCRTKGTVL